MSTGRRIKVVCIWLLMNSLTCLMVALGAIGFGWAWNIYTFLAWMGVIVFGLLAVTKAEQPLLYKDPTYERPVPALLDIILDSGVAVACAAFGHWFYAMLKILEVVLYQYFYGEVKEIKDEPTAP